AGAGARRKEVSMPQSDPNALCEKLRGKLLRAQIAAVEKLARAARGRDVFRNDRELRACIALTRLMPMLMREVPEKTYNCYEDPNWWTDERREDYRILTGE